MPSAISILISAGKCQPCQQFADILSRKSNLYQTMGQTGKHGTSDRKEVTAAWHAQGCVYMRRGPADMAARLVNNIWSWLCWEVGYGQGLIVWICMCAVAFARLLTPVGEYGCQKVNNLYWRSVGNLMTMPENEVVMNIRRFRCNSYHIHQVKRLCTIVCVVLGGSSRTRDVDRFPNSQDDRILSARDNQESSRQLRCSCSVDDALIARRMYDIKRKLVTLVGKSKRTHVWGEKLGEDRLTTYWKIGQVKGG